MALQFTNQNASVPNPPAEQIVYFQVDINQENCDTVSADTQSRLNLLNQEDFSLSFAELIGTAAAHFRGAAIDFSGGGSRQAEIQRTWDNLAHCNPRAVYNSNLDKNRLVVTKSINNPRADGLVAEILAVGIGLSIAIKFLGVTQLESKSASARHRNYSQFGFNCVTPNSMTFRSKVGFQQVWLQQILQPMIATAV